MSKKASPQTKHINNVHTNQSTLFNDLVVDNIKETYLEINTIIIKKSNCVVTTKHGWVTIQGASSSSQKVSYDFLEHIEKNPTQISILELLRSSPIYRDILDCALKELQVLRNITPN